MSGTLIRLGSFAVFLAAVRLWYQAGCLMEPVEDFYLWPRASYVVSLYIASAR